MVNNIIAKAEGLKQANVKIYAPVFGNGALEELQEILTRLEENGWVLTHFPVISNGAFEKGYPVFRYQG